MTPNTTLNRDQFVTAIFDSREDADEAYTALRAKGIRDEDISVVMSKDTRDRYFGAGTEETELGNKATEGAGVGGAIGGTVGGIVGLLAAAAAPVVFPGIGLVLSGPLAAALAGAGAGGLGGSLIGGLVGAGIPEERVKHYEEGLKKGGIVVGVHARSAAEAEAVRDILHDHDGHRA